MDSASYDLTTDITLLSGESLVIQAASGCRPHVRLAGGTLAIFTSGEGQSVTLSGLLVEGGFEVDENLRALRVLHCTLVPGRSVEQENPLAPSGPSLVVVPASTPRTELALSIAFSIVGALRVPNHIERLWVLDSIVVGIEKPGGPPVAAISDAAGASGPIAHIERSTILGTTFFLKLEMASESIFSGVISVEQRQAGCIRFSFVPRGSSAPQQYRFQPALEIALEQDAKKAEAAKTGTPLLPGWDTAIEAEVQGWLSPSFETDLYGAPQFAQLRRTCPAQIRTGAEDGSEMGAFRVLMQPQREQNLRIRLDEYLPVGLDAGLIHVT